MPVIESLIRAEADGTISFGNYKLDIKSKLDNFEHAGDLRSKPSMRSQN